MLIVYLILFLVHLFISSLTCLVVALGYDLVRKQTLSYRKLFLFMFTPGVLLFLVYKMIGLENDDVFFWIYWIITGAGLTAGFIVTRKKAKPRD